MLTPQFAGLFATACIFWGGFWVGLNEFFLWYKNRHERRKPK